MQAAAICGSDINFARMPRDQAARYAKIAMGHEPSGIVESVGEGVVAVKPGDRVSVYHYLGCGRCQQCYAGNLMWCREARGYGVAVSGADADLLLTDERNCFVLPDELSFKDGAFMACAAGTSFSAMKKLQPNGSHTLAIIGLGPVGLAGVLIAKALGARVIAVGRRKVRLELAEEFGADVVVDVGRDDWAEGLKSLAKEIDLAYETSGTPEGHVAAVQYLRRGGKAVFVAGGHGGPSINPGWLVGKQATLMGSFVLPLHMMPELASFIVRHRLAFERMVTHTFSIEEAPEAFRLFASGECGKVMFVWGQELPG